MKNYKKIVCFGGGNLVPKLILEPLRKHPFKITSITSMTESGGSTGQLRKDFNILPAGDISRHLIGLSAAPQWKKKLFYLRFGKEKFLGGHIGHRLGTVFISLIEYITGDFEKALKTAQDFMEVKTHRALPATLNKVQLMAELENGELIEGEDEIDVPKRHNPKLRIKKVFLKPKARIFPETKKALIEADLIILGPGDLYSSIIPCFLAEGMKAAFKKTKAKKVYVCNTMTKLGETNDFSVLDFANEIEKYIGCPLDFVLYHNRILEKRRVEKFRKINSLALEAVKIDKGLPGEKFIGKNLLANKNLPEYNSKKIIKAILNL